MIEELREEIHLYTLLRQLFLREPTREMIDDLSKIEPPDETDGEVNYGLKLLIESVRRNEHRLDEWLEELALEYARLFIGPKNPPAVPYASFYLSESRALMTEETIDVRKRYLEAGMAVKELYSIPDDHIGIELEFIYHLTQKIIEYFEQRSRAEASRLFELRDDFLKDHMSLWIPFFVANLIEFSTEDFYRGSAFVLKGIIRGDPH